MSVDQLPAIDVKPRAVAPPGPNVFTVLGRRATRELVWGSATLAVTLYMVIDGREIPQVLSSLVFALVVAAAVKSAKS